MFHYLPAATIDPAAPAHTEYTAGTGRTISEGRRRRKDIQEEYIMTIKQTKKSESVGEGVSFDRIRRITGYLVGTVDRFNNAKRQEERDRVKHGM